MILKKRDVELLLIFVFADRGKVHWVFLRPDRVAMTKLAVATTSTLVK